MKKLLYLAIAMLFAVSCEYNDDWIKDQFQNHEERIATLETLCAQMNTNITSLQAIVNALQKNDYVTGIAPIEEGGKEIGYTITFSKSGSVTIYHGQSGASGWTPIMGVRQDSDGKYYWTIDGEWIVDDYGNKIPTTGTDGEDGEDGTDGKPGADGADGKPGTDGSDGRPGADGADGKPGTDGADGKDGQDGANGITPLLKIQEDYWYVSYDNGMTWQKLGKATGEDGQDGADGQDGKDGTSGKDGTDGDSFFSSVDTSDPAYVVITMADGTVIKLPTWSSFESLQALVDKLNTNVSSLQAIVEALQNNDYVTSVVPLTEGGKVIGYTMTFSKSGSVVIYHGKDGADGADGKDGVDGTDGAAGVDGWTPVISVKQDEDGRYYWTLDGEWMLDENASKIPTTGEDGKDGEDGSDGAPGTPGTPGNDGIDGQPGSNGTDGITPLLKIEEGYWYVSYDEGQTWQELGKATGENGKDGADGAPGQDGADGREGADGVPGKDGADGQPGKDGDAFFSSVDTSNPNYVVITLTDGTTMQLPTWKAFEELQGLVDKLNTDLSSLQTIVEALQNNDYVTSVVPLTEGRDIIGYTLNFAKSGYVIIYHGQDGQNAAAPVMGVRQDATGAYYWTVDGEWLLNENGDKVPTTGADGAPGQDGSDGSAGADGTNGASGADGITPQLKIEDDYWYVSYDEGLTWQQLEKATGEDGKDGADGDSFFKSVDTSDPNYVMITLTDGTTMQLPTWKAVEEEQRTEIGIELDLENEEAGVVPGEDIFINYTLSNATEETLITASSDGRYAVRLEKSSASQGKIIVTAPEVYVDGYINIMVSDGAGYSLIRVINFYESKISFPQGYQYSIAAEGGELVIPLATNVSYEASTSDSWITIESVETKAALQNYNLKVKVAGNPNDNVRAGRIRVKYANTENQYEEIIINQSSAYFTISGIYYNAPSAGSTYTISASSSRGLTISIPETIDWITISDSSSPSAVAHELTMTVSPNEIRYKRYADIELYDESKETVLGMISIVQEDYSDETKNLHIEGTANCYVVSSFGSYFFPTVKGNSSESVGDVAYAEVLWESFGTEVSPAVGELIADVGCAVDGIVFDVPSPFREGNAVIAAKDESGATLWSWHIWLTDQPEGQAYYNNAGTMLDRNLGATSTTPGDVGALGLLYQWGRKDPFLAASSISENTDAASTIDWPEPVESTSETGKIEYTILNPTTYITSGPNFDWYYTGDVFTNDTRWGSDKTIYDPCPAGWHVFEDDPYGVFEDALDYNYYEDYYVISHDFDETDKGMNFSGTLGDDLMIWYPAGGFRSKDNGKLMCTGTQGRWVSANGFIGHYGISIFHFQDTGDVYAPTVLGGTSRAIANSIRCLKE